MKVIILKTKEDDRKYKNEIRNKKDNLIDYTGKINYSNYLKTNQWRKIRKIILKRDKYKCIICANKYNLNIHHNTYKYLFKEYKHLKSLDTLCLKCHNELHSFKEII